MDERIKKLWYKAAESTAAFSSGQNNSWETQVNFMERFAELIVRECCGAADDWYQKHSELHWDPAQHIRNHFGVEE